MKIKIITLALFTTFGLMGQCPEFSESIILSSQAQVDAFVSDYPNCEVLNSNLIIGHFGAPISTDINDLSGLSPIKRVNGELRVRNVDLLSTFDGLHNIKYVDDDLIIGDNELLKNLESFQNIDSIGKDLFVYRNPNLERLFEADSLEYIGGSLSITDMVKLESIVGFRKLHTIIGSLEIGRNAKLISVAGFDSLHTIHGTFDIHSSAQIVSLTGFENLTTINNGMEIRGTGISDFSGLNNLKQINGTLIGNSVSITDNLNLLTFDGLESLDTLERSLFITGNEQLESIEALSNLEYIGGRLSIERSNLSSIAALSGIAPIDETLQIIDNPKLMTIDDLPLANTIDGSIEIRDNTVLVDISSITQVDTLWGQLRVQDNSLLSDCLSLCPLLTTGFIETLVTVRNNLGDCDDEDDLALLCTTDTQDIGEEEFLQVSPNPTNSLVIIETLSDIDEVILYSADGSVVKLEEVEYDRRRVVLDIAGIQSGLYFVEIVMNDKRVVRKIIKL